MAYGCLLNQVEYRWKMIKVSSTRQSTVLVFVTSLGGRMEEKWRKVKKDIYQVNLVYK